ncbi:hypothetical protein BG015_008602 [Linnemannia schmuckeri]|uniref:Uncharacterized protein n=1 Tax=Linnemannia schmuckeri TaxID=64567 RepID=A0A9P5S5P7_9FUNG|nr:hypothetical protein BG015_008602 [Linnemannia schmuckeri]
MPAWNTSRGAIHGCSLCFDSAQGTTPSSYTRIRGSKSDCPDPSGWHIGLEVYQHWTQQSDKGSTFGHWRESILAIQRLDAAAEAWRRQLPEDSIPTSTKSSVWYTDMNIVHPIFYYYILRISLYRPVLLKAGLVADEDERRKKELSPQDDKAKDSGGVAEVDTDSDAPGRNRSDTDKDFEEKDQRFLRGALDICNNAATKSTVIVDQFTERLARIRGSHLSFPIFIASTAHVLQLTTSKVPSRVAQAKQGLMTCIRSFRMLRPYWTAANDQAMLLEDVLNIYTAKSRQGLFSTSLKHTQESDNNTEQEQQEQQRHSHRQQYEQRIRKVSITNN